MKIKITAFDDWAAHVRPIIIGGVGENLFRTVEINASLWAADHPGCSFALVYTRPDGYTPTPVITVSGATIIWSVSAEDVAVEGTGYIELQLLDGDVIGKTTALQCIIRPSVKTGDPPPESLPDRIEALIQAGVDALNGASAAEAAQVATVAAEVAALAAQAAAELARDTAQTQADRAATEADAAETSAGNAAESEITASQALSDLLAMLGTHIATLTDGKLTPSQIPALSINDVFTVSSASGLTALTAQRGDCGLVVVDGIVTDSYMLSADDPTVASNWVKLGVSYVANAGHSTTADSATNATMVNNKRIVGMTQSQYDVAVLDPDTYYVVTP